MKKFTKNVLIAGCMIVAIGHFYDISYVGLPYQDAPPNLQIEQIFKSHYAKGIKMLGWDILAIGFFLMLSPKFKDFQPKILKQASYTMFFLIFTFVVWFLTIMTYENLFPPLTRDGHHAMAIPQLICSLLTTFVLLIFALIFVIRMNRRTLECNTRNF